MGHVVELVETAPDRLAALRHGRVPFSEPGLPEALAAALEAGALTILDRASDTTAGIVLICVGTPIDDQGRADIRAIEAVLGELETRRPRPVTVVRSTMPVGTSERLLRDGQVRDASRFFAVPEFLRQGTALRDFARPTRVVIGCPPSPNRDAEDALAEIFGAFDAPVRFVTLHEAELIKNGANAFLALKISFANELAVLAERSGADVGPVLEAIGLDPRIGSGYLRPGFGFGGSCLPKELKTIAVAGLERGLEMHIAAAATEANHAHQRLFGERIEATLGGVTGRPIALLGLSFKADTDDLRYSPAIELARWLLAHGAAVRAYDPVAGAGAARAVPGLIVHDTAAEALAGAEAAVIATEWPAFKALDWAGIRETMAAPVVIDGRRLLDPATMRELGYHYERVGSPPRERARTTVG